MKDPVLRQTWSSVKGSRVDLVVYLAVFSVGLVIFFAGKSYGASQLSQTIMLCSLMAAYALSVALVPSLRFRMDQAGDNAYYLGLLFTLTSMAYALYTFNREGVGDGSAGTLAIIQNFGIALATTIAGIFLRVLLHQMRVDPADFEHMTRIELTDAAARLKATLDNTTADFAKHLEEMRQHTQDVVSDAQVKSADALAEFADHLKESNNELTTSTVQLQERLKNGTDELVESIREFVASTTEATERLRSIKEPPLRFSNRVDTILSAFEQLELHIGEISKDLTSITTTNRELLDGAQMTLETLNESAKGVNDLNREAAEQARQAQLEFGSQAGRIAESLNSAAQSWESSGNLMRAMQAQAEATTRDLRDTGGSAREVLVSLENILEKLTRAMDDTKAMLRDEDR